ncbi:proton-coupled folate transporter-like [Acanthaster planci]|uniref:Proton-coupled folate transporter-like n=1 Tax=Acanthaster planci TaxID=133434 RepID=A0A8B7Y041_ACAPL|nr:proton-coupled folate transporter-like [Acanthaster planci]XP_022086523.1 proton-coupled folate transporter-like [Acanthaster planci]XP_022086524.1 proton-coupled folate transporter-like [Acanthaster planci]
MGCMQFVHRMLVAVTVEPLAVMTMTAVFFLTQGNQQFVYFKLCMIAYNETSLCSNLSAHPHAEDRIQAETSRWLLYIDIICYTPTLFTMLILGAWSDRIGRRPPLILACIGSTVLGTMLLVSALWIHLPMPLVLIGWACFGLTGSNGILLSMMFSYVADISTIENRVMRIAILEGAVAFSSVTGVAIAGLLTNSHSFQLLFGLFIVLFLLAMLYTVFHLKETRNTSPSKIETSESSSHSDSEADPLLNTQERNFYEGPTRNLPEEGGHASKGLCGKLFQRETLFGSFVALARKRPGYRRAVLILLLSCFFLLNSNYFGFINVFVLYTTKAPIEWTPLMTGSCSAVVALSNIVLLLTVIPVTRLVGIDVRTVAGMAIVMLGIGFVTMAFARSTPAVWLATVPLYFFELVITIYRGMMSMLVSPDEQGSAFALLDIMGTVAHLFASAVFDNLYPATLHIMSGGVSFLVMCGIEVAQLCLFLWSMFLQKCHRA